MGLQEKVKSVFQYKVVKKNIVNNLKNSIKLPVYVLEYLISQYSDQELTNEEIVNKVKEVLNKHYILPEDKNKIKDLLSGFMLPILSHVLWYTFQQSYNVVPSKKIKNSKRCCFLLIIYVVIALHHL